MNTRERLENRLRKRAEWAESRRNKAAQSFARADKLAERFAGGQPILVGHHSEKGARADQDRIHAAMNNGCESQAMAAHHDAKADGLERMLERNIYSDDEDAPERIRGRIAELTAKRNAMKASNAAYRKGPAAWAAHLGVSAEREAALRMAIEGGYSWCQQPHPAYELTNLGGNIRRLENRIEEVTARSERNAKAADAGVLIEGEEYVRVTFPEKPGRDVLNALRAAGYYYQGGSWLGYRSKLPAAVTEGCQ